MGRTDLDGVLVRRLEDVADDRKVRGGDQGLHSLEAGDVVEFDPSLRVLGDLLLEVLVRRKVAVPEVEGDLLDHGGLVHCSSGKKECWPVEVTNKVEDSTC